MLSIVRRGGKMIYLGSWWHLLNLLIEHLLYAFAHSRYCMVRTIKRETILENEANVGDELICTMVARILRVGIGLGGVGRSQLSLDGCKVHRILDNLRIMGDVKSDRIDWSQKWACILHFLQRANRR